MGICIKNSVDHSHNHERSQARLPQNNLGIIRPINEIQLPHIVNQKPPIQQPPSQIIELPPFEEVDNNEPQPQSDLSSGRQEEARVQSEDQDEGFIQLQKIKVLRKVSSSGIRQSGKDDACGICYQKYEIFNKWPMTICNNEHVICDLCVKDFQKMFLHEPFPCPFCRLLVFEFQIKPSQRVFRSINSKLDYISEQGNEEMRFYLFAFEHELYEIASAYKQNRRKDIRRLEQLLFENRRIERFPYFNYFKNVMFLQLDKNKIKDCQFLLPLSSTLKVLSLCHNQIEQLDWIAGFTNLQILACQYNKIEQITFCQAILLLRQMYLMGNNMKDQQTIDNFKQLEFVNLKILSISSEGGQIEQFYLSQLDSSKEIERQAGEQDKMNEISARQSIFVKNFQSLDAFIIANPKQKELRQVKIIPRAKINQSLMSFIDQDHIATHLNNYYFYGNLFSFKPDRRNPHCSQYRFSSNKLLKLSSNFTSINSSMWIPHVGKQTLKLRLKQKNANIMIGICTRSIKHSASVYSDQFVGITFWGNIYNKAESMPINCDLRINDGSIIAMILDFDKGEISWYIDKRKIGQLFGQRPFLRSKQLYFLYGVRDSEVQVEFIT